MKVCSKCKCEKDDSEFRVRFSIRKTKKYFYLNPTCKKCDSKIALDNYKKKINNPKYKLKILEQSRIRYHKHREVRIENARKYRITTSAKKNRKQYIEKNKDKIYQQEVLCKRRYHEKNRDEISDVYCISRLRQQNKDITPENIEIKRVEILKKRIKIEILKKQRNG